MLRKSKSIGFTVLGLVGGLWLVAAPASASPQKAMKTLKSMMPKKPAKEDKGMCTNFSGTWTGTCVDAQGDSYESTLKIGQYDCSSISFEEDGYSSSLEVGSLTRFGTTSFNYPMDFEIAGGMEWDIARRALLIRANGSFRYPSSNSNGSLESQTTYRLDEGTLKVRYESSTMSGTTTLDKSWEDCAYTKQ